MARPKSPGSPNAAAERDPLGRVVRMGALMDIYGELLTERQRLFVKLHFEDDLSFGEIAADHQVSRQAVHDAVKHAEESLENYEAKLGLLEGGRFKRTRREGTEPASEPGDAAVASTATPAAPADPALTLAMGDVVSRLRDIHDRMRRSGGILYNADGLTREIGALVGRLDEALAAAKPVREEGT